MLSVFPELFSYQLFVPLFFRIVTGLIFIWFGYKKLTNHKETEKLLSAFNLASPMWLWIIALIEIIGGLLITTGAYTQVVAIIFSIFLIVAIIAKNKSDDVIYPSKETLLLLLIITASLLLLGPGLYAFDLPL